MCPAAGRTFVQRLGAQWDNNSTEIGRNVFSDHTVINVIYLERKLQMFCYMMLLLGNTQKKPGKKITTTKLIFKLPKRT